MLRVISESRTDLQPVFDVIAERATTLCSADIGVLVRFDGHVMEVGAIYGLSMGDEQAGRALFPMKPRRDIVSGRSIIDRVAVHVADLDDDTDFTALNPIRKAALRSALAVPMLKEGQCLGALVAMRHAPGLFPEKLITLFQTFADQAVIAIENVRLFNETQEAVEQQTAISDVLRVISESPSDVQPVFDAVTQRAMALCDARIGVATRFDGQRMHLTSLHGVSQDTFDATQVAFPMPPARNSLNGRAVLECATVQIPDMPADPEYTMFAAQETGSGLAVPLMREGRVVGTLMVARKETGFFPEKLVSLLETFADQAVIAIENVRLFNETRDALERQTATAEILRVISSSPTDVQPVFEAIADRSMALCDAQWGMTTRFDGELIHVGAIRGPAPGVVETVRAAFPMKPGPDLMVAQAILDRAPAQTADMLATPDYNDAIRDALRRDAQYHSALAVPMLREGQVIGSIGVARTKPGVFPDKLVSLLETFAAQGVIAIENVRLFNETQEALQRQTATAEILRVISSSPTDLQPVFETIADRAMALCGASVGLVTRVDGEQAHLVVLKGVSEEAAVPIRAAFPMPLDRGSLSTRAVLERAPVQIKDFLADPDISEPVKEAARHGAPRSGLAVPMLLEGKVIGTILVSRLDSGLFPDELVGLLETFAAQAVIAIENARLFNETEEALEQQTAISDILRVIAESPTDVQPVLEAIADHAARLCDAASASIFLSGDDRLRHVASRGPLADQAMSVDSFRIDRTSTSGRAFLDCRTVHVDDMQAEAEEFPLGFEFAQRLGFRTIVVAPLLREGQSFGTIQLRRQEVRPFSARERALLRTFGDQAAIALENVRLFNETKEALEQQTATAEVLRVISSSVDDTAPVFEKILDSCEHLFATEELGIFFVNDGQVHVGAYRGEALEAVTRTFPKPLDETATGVAIRKRNTVNYRSVRNDVDVPPTLIAIADHIGDFSIAIAPMLWEDQAIGSILTVRIPPNPFTDKEIALLTTFADQAVIAIQNARLFNETKEALEQQTATAEVLRVISGSVADTEPVFEKILDSCERLFDTEQLGILLVRDEQIHVGALRGPDVAPVSKLFPVPFDGSALALAIRMLHIVHYPDVSAVVDLPSGLRNLYDQIGNFSFMLAPMLWEGRGVGSINLIRQPPKPFSEKEIELLTTFADQAVIAIENARLFHEIENKSHQLEIANQHKSEFLANMSHELRTPLNAIIGFSEVLIERMFGELNEKQDDYLKDIYTSGKHLLALINDILDLSKIEAGRMEFELETFDVEEALANTLILIRERAQRHGISLKLNNAPDLGEIRADQRKLKQIMLNLLSNAVKFTPDGGRIEVGAAFTGDVLEISVGDTGIGIAESDQETIFQEFRQVGGDYTNKQEGTGLGLALTKRFIELHGGTLGVVSKPGSGSTFTFTLPRQS